MVNNLTLNLYAVSQRGRKAYKDQSGKLFLECTDCKSIKFEKNFLKEKYGFLKRRYQCCECKSEQNRKYRLKREFTEYM
jgi:hypothetical protein